MRILNRVASGEWRVASKDQEGRFASLPLLATRHSPLATTRRGTVAFEFLLVLPIFFTVLIFIMEFGQVLIVEQKLVNGSSSAARVAAEGGTLNDIEVAARNGAGAGGYLYNKVTIGIQFYYPPANVTDAPTPASDIFVFNPIGAPSGALSDYPVFSVNKTDPTIITQITPSNILTIYPGITVTPGMTVRVAVNVPYTSAVTNFLIFDGLCFAKEVLIGFTEQYVEGVIPGS